MEKLFGAVATGLTGWLGYVHNSRPSRKECEKEHSKIKTQFDALCKKNDDMHTDIREIRGLIIDHLSQRNGGV